MQAEQGGREGGGEEEDRGEGAAPAPPSEAVGPVALIELAEAALLRSSDDVERWEL